MPYTVTTDHYTQVTLYLQKKEAIFVHIDHPAAHVGGPDLALGGEKH